MPDRFDTTPTPEFLTACRIVLGTDDAGSVFSALRLGGPDAHRLRIVHAAICRLIALPHRTPVDDIRRMLRNSEFASLTIEDRTKIMAWCDGGGNHDC